MDAIFFDLDGTLTDPKPGITRSIQYALQKLDHPTIPTEDELTWCIGPPLRASFVSLLGADHSADHAVSFYRERFSDVGLYENGVYDGIRDVLTQLCASGHRLFVATSKPHVFAERIIDHFDLRHHFERVFGSELDGTRVDKSHLLEYALREVSVDPTNTATTWSVRKTTAWGASACCTATAAGTNCCRPVRSSYARLRPRFRAAFSEMTEPATGHLKFGPALLTLLKDVA
jgi:phosphoglycolate phosphatase